MEHQEEIDRLVATLADVLGEACGEPGGTLGSQAISSYAAGLRLLAEYGKVEIVSEYGRRVIVKWRVG